MWGHDKMNMLSILPVCLLGVVTIWFLWPLIADPISRRLAVRSGTERERDDLFRALAKHAGPEHGLMRADTR